MYKNIVIDDTITYQDQVIDGCYIVLERLGIDDVKLLKGEYNILIYKTKQIYESNPEWNIYPNEIPTLFTKLFSPEFLDGDIFEKIAIEMVDYFSSLGLINITIE